MSVGAPLVGDPLLVWVENFLGRYFVICVVSHMQGDLHIRFSGRSGQKTGRRPPWRVG